MERIKRLVVEHKFAIILAVLLSLVTVFPQVYLRIDQKETGVYEGIELIPDSPWAARAREVMDNHPNFGAIYYKYGKDSPYVFQPLGSMVVAYMGKVFDLEINNTILLSRIVLPFFCFILLYFFILQFSRDKLLALSGSTLFLYADSLLSFSGMQYVLHGMSPDNFLRLARPVNPAMIYILFFGFMVAFWAFYKKKDWRMGVLATLILGLNFYNYFYTWTYLFAFGGLLGLFLLFRKKWKDAIAVASVYIGSLIIAIPCFINLARVMSSPEHLNASLRAGVVYGNHLVFVGVLVTLSLVLYLVGFRRDDKDLFFYGLAILLAPFITMNQQILTGKILQEDHYHWFFHKPMAVIFMLAVVFMFVARWRPELKKTVAISIIVLSVGTGIFVQAKSYVSDARDGGSVAIERQKYGPAMDWLNANATKEAMVFADDEISHLTVIYTPLNVFYHRAAGYSLVGNRERLMEVLFAFYRLRNVDKAEARDVFFKERGYVSANVWAIRYREEFGSYEAIPDAELESILASYMETLKTPRDAWLKQVFEKHEVEYWVWDKKTNPNWNLDQYSFLTKAAEFGDVVIYKKK